MTELELIKSFVNDDETFRVAQRLMDDLEESDVYYINELGAPHYWNARFLYKVIASTNRRVIASTVIDIPNWQQYFDRVGVVCFDIDDNKVILEMCHVNSSIPIK